MDNGHIALPLPVSAVLAVIGTAGGGLGGGWLHGAWHAYQHPHVQAVAAAALETGASAARAAVEWAEEQEHGHSSSICVSRWQAAAVVGGGAISFLGLCCIFICALIAASGGEGWWYARRGMQPAVHGPPGAAHLGRLANFISQGGEPAIQQVALELAVHHDAVRAWWVH